MFCAHAIRLQALAPEEVEELLISTAIPTEWQELIRLGRIEDMSIDHVHTSMWNFLFQLLSESSKARQMVNVIFSQVMSFTSVNAWIRWAVKYISNDFTGQELFPNIAIRN